MEILASGLYITYDGAFLLHGKPIKYDPADGRLVYTNRSIRQWTQ